MEVWVPGRVCLVGEHSDWAGGFRRFNAEIPKGKAFCCGTQQGLFAKIKKLEDRTFVFKSGGLGQDAETELRLSLDDLDAIREIADQGGLWAYVAGTVLELSANFNVGGLEVDNYRTDLPIKKGLSSSAAVCVLVVRSFNRAFDLKLTVQGEMDLAYRGEINTPSRCGRLDQCVAYGQRVVEMTFDGDKTSSRTISVGAKIFMAIVDLHAGKDTQEILRCLSGAYPFPKTEEDRDLHRLLGALNEEVCERVAGALAITDAAAAAAELGRALSDAQVLFDRHAQPLCPQELTSPVLHKCLAMPELQEFVTGGKGVGSQGDGSAQFVCKDQLSQARVLEILAANGLSGVPLTLVPTRKVTTAVVPLAGKAPDMWPATKGAGPWLFPVADSSSGRSVLKPAVLFLLEELVSAGIEEIVCVVDEGARAQLEAIFGRRERVDVLQSVPEELQRVDEQLLEIGERLRFAVQPTPEGIADALRRARPFVAADRPFLLVWGDHLCSSTHAENLSCADQLLQRYEDGSVLFGLHTVPESGLATCGVLTGKWVDGRLAVTELAEKPTVRYAQEHLRTPNIDGYAGSFGMHVMPPRFFEILGDRGEVSFHQAVDQLRREVPFYGVPIQGQRWDLGTPSSYLECLSAMSERKFQH